MLSHSAGRRASVRELGRSTPWDAVRPIPLSGAAEPPCAPSAPMVTTASVTSRSSPCAPRCVLDGAGGGSDVAGCGCGDRSTPTTLGGDRSRAAARSTTCPRALDNGAAGRNTYHSPTHVTPAQACGEHGARDPKSLVVRVLPDGPRAPDGTLAFTSGVCVYLPPGYATSGRRGTRSSTSCTAAAATPATPSPRVACAR